jgi:hypothetical protein
MRPGFGPAAELPASRPARRRHGSCSSLNETKALSQPLVFISYVRENASAVDRLVEGLRAEAIDVWRDTEQLTGGSIWPDEIKRAISRSDFFIACFSHEYTARHRAYMGEELTQAIDEMRLRQGQTWFLPVVLSGDVPDWSIGGGKTLRSLQWVALADAEWANGITALVRAVRTRFPALPSSATETTAPARIDAIRATLRKFPQERHYYVAPRIPARVIRTAARYCRIPHDDEIIAMLTAMIAISSGRQEKRVSHSANGAFTSVTPRKARSCRTRAFVAANSHFGLGWSRVRAPACIQTCTLSIFRAVYPIQRLLGPRSEEARGSPERTCADSVRFALDGSARSA